MLRIDVPRGVSARGRDAVGYALLSVFVAGVLVLLALLTALRRMVLRPVTRLTRHAVAIAEGDDLTRRMNVMREDEIGILAREFDRMVDKLADARGRLVDQSFEAGRRPGHERRAAQRRQCDDTARRHRVVAAGAPARRARSAKSRWCWRTRGRTWPTRRAGRTSSSS